MPDKKERTPEEQVYWEDAKNKFTVAREDIQIDDDAEVSIGEDGAWVRAWVFVEKE